MKVLFFCGMGILCSLFETGCAVSNGKYALAVGFPIEARVTKPTYFGDVYYDVQTGIPTIRSSYSGYEYPDERN